jgi:uncharacterized protein (DUF1778 family)
MATRRLAVTLDEDTCVLVERWAAIEKRSVSSLINYVVFKASREAVELQEGMQLDMEIALKARKKPGPKAIPGGRAKPKAKARAK